jgi:TetR/AcrR family acrAB operon transcriptional repressor
MKRTKEEAALTREAIVEAALACFHARGIAHATLDQIAAQAGVTKGAVYHHFDGKGAILHEIRERVSLPLLDTADTTLLAEGGRPALERLESFLTGIIDNLEACPRTRRALGVMQFKCEYVGDLHGELGSMIRKHRHLLEAFEGAYRHARAEGALRPGLAPEIAALETALFLNGLVRLWLLDGGAGGVRPKARALIRSHVGQRAASISAAPAKAPRRARRKPAARRS